MQRQTEMTKTITNQMMIHGGLQPTLKTHLAGLPVNGSTELVDYSFCQADIQECCDRELPDMKFHVGEARMDGGRTIRTVVRLS